jgi:predicted Zn-dependent protease
MRIKTISLLALLALSSSLVAQEPAKSGDEKPAEVKLSPNQEAFLNLPEEARKELVQHYTEANRLFAQKRIFETLEEIDKADKIFPDGPELLNLRGSCYVEMRAFDKALIAFHKALVISPNNPSIKFNVGEIYFVTKQWKKCITTMEEVIQGMPKNDSGASRLLEFKVMLSKKKLGMNDEALAMAKKYDFLDDSPYHYYAEAALAYDKGDLQKAEEWMSIAGRIFRDPAMIMPWQDTFVEYGYIKSFYGNETVK